VRWLWPWRPRKGHRRPQDQKMVQNVEAIAIQIDHKMAEIAKAKAKREGRVNPNDLTERAGNGRPKDRVNLDGPDDQAGNKCPKMRSTKMPTKSGHGFSIKTVNENISSGDDFSVAMERRLGVPPRTMTSTTRRQEQPSGHTRLEQQLGGEDCAGVVCWQKPPGCTGRRQRHCRFFTGQCNERWRCSVGQEANGQVAVPPSLKGLVGLLYERSPKKCKEAGGAQDNGMASPSRPLTKTSQAGTIFCRLRTQGREHRHGRRAQQQGGKSGPQDMPDWSSSWGKKTVLVLFAGRNPQDVPGYARGAAGFLPGGAMSTGGAALARRPTGGLQRHPASMALLGSRASGS
jgi:hypothetical protein